MTECSVSLILRFQAFSHRIHFRLEIELRLVLTSGCLVGIHADLVFKLTNLLLIARLQLLCSLLHSLRIGQELLVQGLELRFKFDILILKLSHVVINASLDGIQLSLGVLKHAREL